MKYTSEELWDIFHEAYMECPQTVPIESFQREIGYPKTFGEIKQDLKLCLKFWLDKNSIGGSLLWTKDYAEYLPEDVLKACEECLHVDLNRYVKIFKGV